MTDLENAIVYFLNDYQRQHCYIFEDYQLLHGVKYRREMEKNNINLLRSRYKNNSFEASYELKTYYIENHLLSNTIVLKRRPKKPEMKEIRNIKIYNEVENRVFEYTHHAIEIFKEDGNYKVFDVLHRDKSMLLEDYLEEICEVNHCQREHLRYDMGYLAPCHAFADNMQELSDLMRYLDKSYKIGKPRLNLIDIPSEEGGMLLSDDMYMDFKEFGKKFGVEIDKVIEVWTRIYHNLFTVQYNLLHSLCLYNVMGEPLMKAFIKKILFTDSKICEMIEKMPI